MPATTLLKALGLNTSPNTISDQPGSLIQASNVIIKRDNVIESRRGFRLYGESFGTSTDTASQLISYKNVILRHYNTTLQYDTQLLDGTGQSIFNSFFGSYSETDPGLRIKSIESNGNLYFTTSNGIEKISAVTSSNFTTNSGYITRAGGIKALDLTATLDLTLGSSTGFLPVDSTVAYRVVWNINDLNNNLIQGTPSQQVVVSFPFLQALLPDFARLLGALDDIGEAGGSLIIGTDYVSTLLLPESATASQLQTNLFALSTKLDNEITITSGNPTISAQRVTTTTGKIIVTSSLATRLRTGDILKCSGFSSGGLTDLNGDLLTVTSLTTTSVANDTVNFIAATPFSGTDGAPVADVGGVIKRSKYSNTNVIPQPPPVDTPTPNSELLALQTYLQTIITDLQQEPSGVISTPSQSFLTPIVTTTSANVDITITVPQDATLNNFFQIYRSDVFQATGTEILSDLVPNDELRLVYEAYPTQAELDSRLITVEDIVLPEFAGANLYTNEISGEGILQANDIPPFAKDINRFKNVVFYANTKTRQRKGINLLGVVNMLTDYNNGITPKLTIASSSTDSNTYSFVAGVAQSFKITARADVAGDLAGKYFTLNSAVNAQQYYVWYKVSGSGTDPAISGKIGIEVDIIINDSASTVATRTKNTLNTLINVFTVSTVGSQLTITNVLVGAANNPTIGTSGFTLGAITTGVGERVQPETTLFTFPVGAANTLYNTSGASNYFTLNTAFNRDRYYVWMKLDSSTDPAVAGRTGIQVNILDTDTEVQVASKVAQTLNNLSPAKFSCIASTNTVTVVNIGFGTANIATTGTMPVGFTLVETVSGALDVLLSTLTSPAQAVDETARSLVRVINRNQSEVVYGYYLSSSTTLPGLMSIEARELNEPIIYFLTNNKNTGSSFDPNLAAINQTTDQLQTISNISAAFPSIITTTNPHGLLDGDSIIIDNSNSTPIIDGVWPIKFIDSTHFSINANVTGSGNRGVFLNINSAIQTQDEEKPNRIYYSKILQPEAVPLVNFFDVGAQDKNILRILPLRDSLFVFKEDGLFRISGETAPFNTALFDTSCILIAADSLSISNNIIYGWTKQGISLVTEAGTSIVSRPIDVDILPKATAPYTHFSTATWGVGYESDNSYIVFTVVNTTDTVAKIGYRYSNLTNSWTTFDKSNTCGIINTADDKLYMGAGDTNFIEQERKDFTRYDYSDREFTVNLTANNYLNNGFNIRLTSITGIAVGDVLVQNQLLTIYTFNALLQKLDLDPGLINKNYYSTLIASGGADMRTKIADVNPLLSLSAKLDADPGIGSPIYNSTVAEKSGTITANTATTNTIITTSAPHGLVNGRIVTITGSNSVPSIDADWQVTVIDNTHFSIPSRLILTAGTTGTFITNNVDFRDIEACYNEIILLLNSDSGAAFDNYLTTTNTDVNEAIITNVNVNTKQITLNVALPYIIGPMTVFKAIESTFTYTPNTMGEPLGLKHLRESTVMFENKAFTNAILSFSTDLLPAFIDVNVIGNGNGIFGSDLFGNNFFGGGANAAPFRTYVPRNCQRCRFLNIRYTHNIAREKYSIFGITITGEVSQSTRAYR